MPKHTIRIATRKSPLALWQAQRVGDLLKQQWPDRNIELLPMLTSGDKFTRAALQSVGGKGLFVKELEEALLDNRADLAVHSMKDVPAFLPQGLEIAALCPRDNPFDAFVSTRFATLASLPKHSIVGTASLRRQSQLLAIRPDLRIQTLRGNINTRLARLEQGDFDAIILAAAGLIRMDFQAAIREQLSDEIMLPACGQGALGMECRSDDSDMKALLAPLHDPATAVCVDAERRVNTRLGGNCHVPLAVYCQAAPGDNLHLRARVLSLDGTTCLTDERQGPLDDAQNLADACADHLLTMGAAALLDSV